VYELVLAQDDLSTSWLRVQVDLGTRWQGKSSWVRVDWKPWTFVWLYSIR